MKNRFPYYPKFFPRTGVPCRGHASAISENWADPFRMFININDLHGSNATETLVWAVPTWASDCTVTPI